MSQKEMQYNGSTQLKSFHLLVPLDALDLDLDALLDPRRGSELSLPEKVVSMHLVKKHQDNSLALV